MNGFFNESEGAFLHRFDRLGNGAMSRDHDDLAVGKRFLGPGKDLHAIDVVHHQISNYDVVVMLIDFFCSFWSGSSLYAIVSHAFEDFRHGLRVVLVVIDNQDPDGRGVIVFRRGFFSGDHGSDDNGLSWRVGGDVLVARLIAFVCCQARRNRELKGELGSLSDDTLYGNTTTCCFDDPSSRW